MPTVDSGPDAPAAVAMCMATFATYNRTTLGAQTNPGGQCAGTADLDVICGNDVGGVARSCGSMCVRNGGAADCTSICVRKIINPSVSDTCLSCYSMALTCTIDKCQSECIEDSSSARCVSCQQAKGCLALFYSCSGLPLPTSSAPDAGGDATAG